MELDVQKELKEMGIKHSAQVAAVITDNRMLNQVLMAVEPGKRVEAYEALKPHLAFKASPYWMLIRRPKRKKQKDTAKGYLELTCQTCPLKYEFFGNDREEAFLQAKEAGWTIQDKRVICPGCKN